MPRRPQVHHICAWWPDQIAGALVAITSAMIVTQPSSIIGTGVGQVLGDLRWLALAWIAVVGLARAITVASVQARRDGVTAAALVVVGVGLAANAVITTGVNGSEALAASMAYGVSAIYLWERARVHASMARHMKALR